MTTFKRPKFLVQTTLGATFAQGATTLTLAAGGGAPFGTVNSGNPVRFTVVKASAVNSSGAVTDRTLAADYTATGLSGDVFSGVSFDGIGTDQAFASGDVLFVASTVGTLSDIHTAVNANETTLAGLGTIATHAATEFLLVANNLSDVTAGTARTNLGLGSIATHATTEFQAAGSYLTTTGNGSGLTGLTGSQISGNIAGNAANVTGTVALANGGTGQTTKQAAFDALSPNGNLGDLTYYNASNHNVALTGNITTAKQFLTQTGAGASSNAPAWGAILAADVPDVSSTYATVAQFNSVTLNKQSNLVYQGVKTANYTVGSNELVLFDTSGGAVTATLPTPADKTQCCLKLVTAGNTLTVACSGSDVFNKAGGPTTATLTLANQAVTLQYSSTLVGWVVKGDDLPLSQLDLRFSPLAGSSSIATLGTVATGVWHGTAVGAQYGGTGLDTHLAANGSLLIGNGSGLSLATLTAGSNVTVTNGVGTVTIAASGGGSLAVGGAVSGGGANRLLYEDGSQNLASSAGLTFDGSSFAVSGSGATPFTLAGLASVVPLMLDNSHPSPYVAASNNSSSTAYYAFDGNAGNPYIGSAVPAWVRIDLGASGPKTVTQYKITATTVYFSQSPKTWTFEGSPDASTWTVLDTQTNASAQTSGESRTYSFSNSTSYRYYRLNVSASQAAGSIYVAELKLYAAGTALVAGGQDGVTVPALTATGPVVAPSVSVPQVGASSEAFGLGATTGSQSTCIAVGTAASGTGAQATAVGVSSNCSGNYSVAVGYSAAATADFTVAVGQTASVSGANSTAVGEGATVSGASSTVVGMGVVGGSFAAAVTVGRGATATAANQFLAGSASYPINAAVFVASSGGFTLQPQVLSSLSTPRNAGKVAFTLPTGTDASFKGRAAVLSCDFTGTDREGFRVESDGTQALVGFFGHAAASKQSTPVTLADVIALLQAYGLCT